MFDTNAKKDKEKQNEEIAETPAKKFAKVISDKPLNFREFPNGGILATLKKGTKLEVLDPFRPNAPRIRTNNGKWTSVIYDGTEGWVVTEYIEVITDGQYTNNN